MMIDYCLWLPFTRKILDHHVGTLYRTHAENCPEKSLQSGFEAHERAFLFDFYLCLVVGLHHSVVVLIQFTESWRKSYELLIAQENSSNCVQNKEDKIFFSYLLAL